MEFVDQQVFVWERQRNPEFCMRFFNSVFLPEILPGTADPDEPLPFKISEFFARLKIKVYFQEKWNLMITVQDEQTFSFYRVYPRNEDVVNFPVIQMSYPTYKLTGDATPLFYSALLRDDCDGICCEKSSKGGVEHVELREVATSEIMIQFLLNFITRKKEIPVVKINKKHKNQVLWNDALLPWRRNFRWLGLKILLKEHCSRELYQQIIAEQLVEVVYNAFLRPQSLFEPSNEYCKRRILQKISKKMKKHPSTAGIIEPMIKKILSLPELKEVQDRESTDSCSNCFTINKRSFKNYHIPKKPSEISQPKTFSPRPPSRALFLHDQDFLYYFDHDQITLSRKILYCADWIAREHQRLVNFYPELKRAIFGFDLNIFNRLLLPFRKDRDLCCDLLSYFQRYYLPSDDYLNNESISFALGQRFFQKEIQEYLRNETKVIDKYLIFVGKERQKIEAYKKQWDEWREWSCCKCNDGDDASCYHCRTNRQYSNHYENLCKYSIQKLEKCLPDENRNATILYTELNYPDDLKEFRNNYYHFLTLFHRTDKVQNTFLYESSYPSYISSFKRYDDSFQLTVNLNNMKKGNYTIFSGTKPIGKSHYYRVDSRDLSNEDLICSFAMNRNYGYRDREVCQINFNVVNYPSLSVRRPCLQQYLVPREADNTVYANQEEGELDSNLQHIKYGEVLLDKEIRYRHLLCLLDERVLDLNDGDVLNLVKTLLWLSESVAIDNAEKDQLFLGLERHVKLISRNCDKVAHMEALIHILNRLLTEEEGGRGGNEGGVNSWQRKESYLNLMKEIRLILLEWKKVINDDSIPDYPGNTVNKTLMPFLKIADLEVFSYMHENDVCSILKAANFIYENQLNIITGFSLEVREVLSQYSSYPGRSTKGLTDFLGYKRGEVIDDVVVWGLNGLDAYCYYCKNLYEMNRQTGEYFINNNPLKTLPDRIRAITDIKRLFKTRNIKAALLVNGAFHCPDYSLTITELPEKGEIIIEEKVEDCTYQYVSPNVFNDELSSDLLEKYHWLKIRDGEDYQNNNPTIEFRSNPFKSPGNNRNTKVNYLLFGKQIINQDTGEYYSDIHSQNFKDIFLSLTPHVNIWNHRIELYTLDLTFVLDEDSKVLCFNSIPLIMNSPIMRRVNNKVVLKDDRIIVVWDGKAFHFRYKPSLNYVVASDSLLSWLYLAFTYGNSSYHREAWDVLTTQCFNSEGMTETDLKGTEIDFVFKRIQSLSPDRNYYPSHLRRMEKVTSYNRSFDGYYLWVYEFLHLRRINENDLIGDPSLRLRIRSFLLNHELYPFASSLLFDFAFPASVSAAPVVPTTLPRVYKTLYQIFEGSTVEIGAFFPYSTDPKEAFQTFINTRSYDKVDLVRLIYLNSFSEDIVTLMSHLPVQSSDHAARFPDNGQYFISHSRDAFWKRKKCWQHRSCSKYWVVSGCKDCESLYQSNLLFINYLTSQFTTRDVVDCPFVIPYQYKVIVPPLFEYFDESIVGKLRREARNNPDHPSLHNLLNEITGISLREKQIEIANHLLNNAENLTTQLNMGEGKTSMILPLMILRGVFQQHRRPLVIFKKSLFHMHSEELIHKLGLLGVKCFHFKSQRTFTIQNESIEYLETIPHLLLLMIPEDKQSFEIRMAERRQNNRTQADRSQSLINENTLTIIDESDDVLHPRNQLVWTYGSHEPIEESLLRYRLPRIIFSRLQLHKTGEDDYLLYEDSIDYPRLCDDVVEEVFVRLSPSDLALMQRTLREMIRNNDLSPSSIPELHGYEGDYCKAFFSLMRFYIGGETNTGGGGLLFNCLSSRCRVNYGVDSKRRSKLAVPYLAKDIPSDKSEFANVDKTILLSYLYYYSEGILLEDIQSTWKRITKPIYDSFQIDDFLPYESVNSYILTREYDRCFRKNKVLINFWLETIVFPKFLNQFPLKRCASSWNLINSDRTLKTCGFSGTNGMKSLQPNTIRQEDLLENLTTNQLLDRLIEEQAFHPIPIFQDYNIYDVLLELQVDVVIDVGSLIIENNETFSKQWLQKSTERRRDKSVVLFFDQNNRRLCYDYNSKKIERYELSKFKDGGDSLSACLVYIDQSHCIGTHYDFPSHFRAVVTLGKNVTRDALAQGCMRMRQLAKANAHRITFVTNEKIFSKVKSSCDVLKYCYDYTNEELLKWEKAKRSQQQHYEQGIPLVTEIISIHEIVENMHSEQEKELEKEIEEERAIERPPKLPAKMHRRYPYIDEILQGRCPDPIASKFTLFSSNVYVSRDWETVHLTSESHGELYKRIPRWILSFNENYYLAISSYEASLLYRRKNVNNLHCITNIYHKNQHNASDNYMSSSLRLFFLNLFYPSKTIETEFCRFIGLVLNRRKKEEEEEQEECGNTVGQMQSFIIERKVEEFYHLSHLQKLLTKGQSNFEE